MHYVGSRVCPSERSPFRSHAAIFGYSDAEHAAIQHRRERRYAEAAVAGAGYALLDARADYCQVRRDIGEANRCIVRGLAYPNANPWQRRRFRSMAFSRFNPRLKLLRQAEKALAEAQTRLATRVGA